MTKLFVTDMDGTLLNSTKQLPADFGQVVNQLEAKGHILAFASGRSYLNMKPLYQQYSQGFAYICDNGATVAYRDKIVYRDFLSKEEVEDGYNLHSLAQRLFVCFCGENHNFVKANVALSPEEEKELIYYYPDYQLIDNLDEIEEGIIKVTLMYLDDIEKNIADKVVLPASLSHPVTGYIWIDIFHDYNNKAVGTQRLQQALGISKEDTYVFGDYYNDLPLREVSSHAYATSNAIKEVKACFDEVIGSCEEGAVTAKIAEILKEE